MIAETDHQGKAIKAYIYAGETRVALLDYRHNPQGELYFIHNDHLGTPKLITNSAQEIVWRNTSSAFGQVQTAQANGNSAQALEQNLSFPGQYRDTETGFSYNYFRDYDPSLGRYIQSDPIGLEGGVNTYGYVMGNPVGLVDPLGLCDDAYEDIKKNINNGVNGVGGAAQIAAGVAACSTGVGCIAGIPLIVMGVSNVGESATGFIATDGAGFNFVQAAIERGFNALGQENASNLAVTTNAVLNLSADLAGLNAPAVAKGGFSLYRNISADYTRAVNNISKSGLIIQGTSTVNTTYNVY